MLLSVDTVFCAYKQSLSCSFLYVLHNRDVSGSVSVMDINCLSKLYSMVLPMKTIQLLYALYSTVS